MKSFISLFALALVAGILQFAVPSTASADELSLFQALQPTMLAAVSTDITTTPSTATTWGRVKSTYRGDSTFPNASTADTSSSGRIAKPGMETMASYGGDWSNNIISESFYTLNKYRTGSSNVVYQGQALSDWPYVISDPGALSVMTSYIGGTYWRGGIDGTWNGGSRGGYCKFFVDLVLYRSSYGIGGGNHLVLPAGTYNYAGYMTAYAVRDASRGMVVQRGGSWPHSAIVVANLGWGLDLIDSNYIGSDGNFVIARHAMSWSQLSGFTAYRANYMRQF